MKRILISVLIGLSFFAPTFVMAATNNCGGTNLKVFGDGGTDVKDLLKDCNPEGAMEGSEKKEWFSFFGISVGTTSNEGYKIENAKGKLFNITSKLVILASILAIGGLVYSGILFTTGLGNNDKMKKAKDAIKWSLIGFALALISQQLINAIINLVYSISST